MVGRTDNEMVEVLVGEIIHGEFHGKRIRFEGREVDRYDTGESRHVLYECGSGRYRILVERFDDGREIYPRTGDGPRDWRTLLRGFHPGAGGCEMATQGAFRHSFPVEDIEE